LPDGLFSNQKSQFGLILEGLAIEDVSIFYGIWSILRPFDIFSDYLVYIVVILCISLHVGILNKEKSGNPGVHE
jgi:hypothetical protein